MIAELSRKLEDTNDVIREESEFEETSVVTDSCLEEEDEEDDVGGPIIKKGFFYFVFIKLSWLYLFTNSENPCM